jgi:hypothetical protein
MHRFHLQQSLQKAETGQQWQGGRMTKFCKFLEEGHRVICLLLRKIINEGKRMAFIEVNN